MPGAVLAFIPSWKTGPPGWKRQASGGDVTGEKREKVRTVGIVVVEEVLVAALVRAALE